MGVALNWLWQGSVIALVTALVLRVLPRWRANERCGLVSAAYVAVLLLPAVPLLGSVFTTTVSVIPIPAVPPVAMSTVWWTSGMAALVAWTIWAAASGARSAAAMLAVRKAKRESREFPAALEARLPHWRHLQATGRRARLVLSDAVRTAGVLGGGTPIIAVSPRLLDHLSVADVDRVLVHEWAHVQRRDDVGQVGVRVMRAIAGWHPAVWWLERQLHVEREVACDEIAVAVTGCARAYATCLTAVAAMPVTAGVSALAVVSSPGLRQRVMRILADRHASRPRASGFALTARIIAMSALAVTIGRVQLVEALRSTAPLRPVIADPKLAHLLPVAGEALRADSVRPRIVRRPARKQYAASEPTLQSPDVASTAQAADSSGSLLPATAPLTAERIALPGAVVADPPLQAATAVAPAATQAAQVPAWEAAVEAGKAMGAGSEHAAVAAGRFFSRIGKQVAGSF